MTNVQTLTINANDCVY